MKTQICSSLPYDSLDIAVAITKTNYDRQISKAETKEDLITLRLEMENQLSLLKNIRKQIEFAQTTARIKNFNEMQRKDQLIYAATNGKSIQNLETSSASMKIHQTNEFMILEYSSNQEAFCKAFDKADFPEMEKALGITQEYISIS